MDTVFNWGELWAARAFCKRAGIPEPVLNAVAQGDDDQVSSPSYGAAAALTQAYSEMNFEVNPGKFFIDSNRDEFLRQVAVPGEVSGYMVRAVLALLWRNPISRDPPIGLLRLSEQLKSWNLTIGRGADRSTALKLMLIDMTQGNGLSKDEVIRILQTPATVGGLGVESLKVAQWLAFKPGKIDVRNTIEISSVRGLSHEVEVWKSFGMEFTRREAVAAIKDNLELSDAAKEVTAGTLEAVDFVTPYMWKPEGNRTSVPRRARSREELPLTLNTAALEKAIRARDWTWVRDVWLDPSLRDVSDLIETKGGRTVWVDWLKGKLPWKLPTILGWSDLIVSTMYNAIADAVWSRVVSFHEFNYRDVRRAGLTAELWTHENVRVRKIRLGG
jgi:hypothetical protein